MECTTKKTREGVWDPKVAVEQSGYFWQGDPIVRTVAESYRDPSKLGIVDLFCGAGGFSVGFEEAGFQSILGVDIHVPSIETYSANRPGVPTILGDIRRITTEAVAGLTSGERISVVTAGVPCQGFSLANRKRHDGDDRNFLFWEFIRFAEQLQPTAVLVENVSGMLSSASGRFVDDISREIARLGYDVHVGVLNAVDFGVPQFRQRLFFVGVPRGAPWTWPTPCFGASGARPYRTVGDAILDLPPLDAGSSADAYCQDPTTDLQVMLRGDQTILLNHVSPTHPDATIQRIASTKPGMPMYEAYRQRIRLHPDMPSPTQVSGGIRPQFQFGHPTQPRGLTVRERARIQTFPDRYFFAGGVVQGRVQTGNAVPVILAKELASHLRTILESETLPRGASRSRARQDRLWDHVS